MTLVIWSFYIYVNTNCSVYCLILIISIPNEELFSETAVGCIASYFVSKLYLVPVGSPPPPVFWCCVLLYLRSPKGCCCSISDDSSCSRLMFSEVWMVFILVTPKTLFHDFKQDCFVSLILRFNISQKVIQIEKRQFENEFRDRARHELLQRYYSTN